MKWWGGLKPGQRLGFVLALVGVGLTALLAFLGNQTKPPSASTQALLALFGTSAQVGSAFVFSRIGKADPGLAERSVAQLYKLASRASYAKELAEDCTEKKPNVVVLREAIKELSVHLSYLEDGYISSIDDWRIFHPDAVERAARGNHAEGK